MELHSSSPSPYIPPLPRVTVPGMEYRVVLRPASAAPARDIGGHDPALMIAALEAVEVQRRCLETLLDAGVLGSCLSD